MLACCLCLPKSLVAYRFTQPDRSPAWGDDDTYTLHAQPVEQTGFFVEKRPQMDIDFSDIFDKMTDYPDKELTRIIIGAAFEVHNILGSGFLEKVYQNALNKELQSSGLKTEVEVKVPVYYKNDLVGEYSVDILVEDRVILELKALSALTTQHEAQLLNYLKATGHKLGLLLNFGTNRVQVKRKIL
jgi:GxxExxY protein